jgi:hypothetical protein
MKVANILQNISAVLIFIAASMGFYVIAGKVVAPNGLPGAFDSIQYSAIFVAFVAFAFLLIARKIDPNQLQNKQQQHHPQ